MDKNTVRRRRNWNRAAAFALVAALAVVVAAPSAWAAPACATAEDEATLNARVLQTELMVAALACGEQQRYNDFVKTFKTELSQRGRMLRAYFKRVHGASGESRMNAFVTKLANDASQRTANAPDAYCAAAAKLFNDVLAASPRDFTRIAARPELGGRHGYARCRPGS
ncbi:MAG: hypothetical protein U0S49_15555 [Rhodospirillales bacterium]|nr:hypothetical protein [Rhodospirillales bacterium]